MAFSEYSESDLANLTDEELEALAGDLANALDVDRKENQLEWYEPVSERAWRIHMTPADLIGIGGGNGSGKSESTLVEMISCATGVFPHKLRKAYEEEWGPDWWKKKSPAL